jgi:NADPH:quinone reductase
MRCAMHHAFGEPADVLVSGDAPVPQPGPGEVRVRTLLAPIHNHDLWTIRGHYGYRPPLPAIGGSEALGVIDALGEGVDGLSVGQRVNAAAGRGTWAESFLVSAKMVVPMPETVDDATAAQLIAMPLSALMLLESLQLEPGQWIVQNAANGAVGRTLAMLAAARGIHVLGLVRRDAGVDELAAAGIAHVVSTAQADWKREARAILGEAGARAAVDSVGGQASADLLSLLGQGGTLVAFGAMAGEAMLIPPGEMIFRQLTVKGFWGSTVGREMPAADRRRLVGELVQRAASGELALPADAVYPLEEAAKAAAESLRPGRKGKVLLRPQGRRQAP